MANVFTMKTLIKKITKDAIYYNDEYSLHTYQTTIYFLGLPIYKHIGELMDKRKGHENVH